MPDCGGPNAAGSNDEQTLLRSSVLRTILQRIYCERFIIPPKSILV
jgi:hypothetical protein